MYDSQRSNCQHVSVHWNSKSFKKHLLLLYWLGQSLTVWITTNWQIFQETGIPDHLTCLLRNLYAGQEITVRTEHGTTDWFQTGKGVHQGCILSPCFFNFYEEYIMRNARLDEAQAGIKVARRNINNLRYANDTTPMAESKELKSLLMWNNSPPPRDQIIKLNLKPWGGRKSLLMKMKEESEKNWLKTQHSEN